MAAPPAATPGDELGPRLALQRALLERLLGLAQGQRARLVAGDPVALMRVNGAIELLLQQLGELCEHPEAPDDAVPPEVAREVSRVARELRRELRANYALACHGARLVGLPLALFAGAGSAPAGGLRLVDGSG